MNCSELINSYRECRSLTLDICRPLTVEDHLVQSTADVSPIKWHLGHTTWFFDHLVLRTVLKNYESPFPWSNKIFNSYYQTQGIPWTKESRHVLSRPTLEETLDYRKKVDHLIAAQLESSPSDELYKWVELGLHHEQQHQELMLMDIKMNFYQHPFEVKYQSGRESREKDVALSDAKAQFPETTHFIGRNITSDSFSYDNESPKHKVLTLPFSIATQMVSYGDYIQFIQDDGYARPEFWLSDAWDQIKKQNISSPLYMKPLDDKWMSFELSGWKDVTTSSRPIQHISFHEAKAFAKWKQARLPTEQEWELFATDSKTNSLGFLQLDQPLYAQCSSPSNDIHGQLWQWTESAYTAYPGYQAPAGAYGEYNSKFMNGQQVLRGGSFATPKDHYRPSYRNFYPSPTAWAFTGFRLAWSEQ